MKFYDEWDEEEVELRESIIRRARTEGIQVAYESAISVCRDTRAPQMARANASRVLLTIGGMMSGKEGSQPPKELYEMTAEELNAAAARARRRRIAVETKEPVSEAERSSLFD